MLLSVIIAVYNGEKYLPTCLDSISVYPYDDMECIIINDGSGDETGRICEDFAREDGRFRVVHKDNSGVSDSRNLGMRLAKGKYLMFVDADDYIKTGSWATLRAYARAGEYDMAAFGYITLFASGREQREDYATTRSSNSDMKDVYLELLSSPMLNTCWGKLLRRATVEEHGLKFHRELTTGEDAVFIIDFVEKAKTAILINEPILCYRLHEGSAMRRSSMVKKMDDFSALYHRRKDFLAQAPDDLLHAAMYRQFFSVITDLFLQQAVVGTASQNKEIYRQALQIEMVEDILAHTPENLLTQAFKRRELLWMRKRKLGLLAVYFRLKSKLRKR